MTQENHINSEEGEMITRRKIGSSGPEIGRIGYGAMVLEGFYGPSVDDQAKQTIQHALDVGMTMIDTADAYGNGHNESLLGEAVQDTRNRAFLCTKFGIVFDENETGSDVPTGWGFSLNINGTPEYAAKCLENSLRRLNVDVIDLWYLHFPDPNTPIEETVGAMSEAVQSGKVRYLGLSNVTAEQVQRAHQVHPVTAVQYEYSLRRREAETTLLPTLRNLDIALVPWAPLGSGFLSGTVNSLNEGDFRANNPRYAGDNLQSNLDRFAPLMDIADDLLISQVQLALAWLLHQGDDIFPIPGTRSPDHIDENAQAADIRLSETILRQIDELFPPGTAVGATLV